MLHAVRREQCYVIGVRNIDSIVSAGFHEELNMPKRLVLDLGPASQKAPTYGNPFIFIREAGHEIWVDLITLQSVYV